MENQRNTSIVLYGEFDAKDSVAWKGFYHYAETLMNDMGRPANHIGVQGDSFRSGKVLGLPRARKRFLNSLERNETVVSLEIYALPEEFLTASFDYEILVSRAQKEPTGIPPSYILVSFNSIFNDFVRADLLIDRLKHLIALESGQVFSLSYDESSAMYAAGITRPECCETLEIMQTF